jgi:hypothetical protein
MQWVDSKQQTATIAVSRHRNHSAHTGGHTSTPCTSISRLPCNMDDREPDSLTVRGNVPKEGLRSDHGLTLEQSCNQQLISLPSTDMALPISRSYVNLRYLASSHPLHIGVARFGSAAALLIIASDVSRGNAKELWQIWPWGTRTMPHCLDDHLPQVQLYTMALAAYS